MLEISLDMFQATTVACFALLLGRFITAKVSLFKRYCIPDPVVGGLVFALIHMALKMGGIMEITMDTTLQNFFMYVFFTGIGFSASLKMLKEGGKKVAVFLGLSVIMCFLQNGIGGAIAGLFGLDPRIGTMSGSVALVGGLATAATFAPVFEEAGVEGAQVVGIVSATFGLMSGCLIGGPVATKRIRQHNLHSAGNGASAYAAEDILPPAGEEISVKDEKELLLNEKKAGEIDSTRFLNGMIFLIVATGLGTIISKFLSSFMIFGRPFTFPMTMGGLMMGAILRNIWDALGKEVPGEEIDTIGDYSLMIFLGMALVNLKLWQLADLALPMIVMLAGQIILMIVFSYYVIFNIMGRDYEAAVITTGFVGFAMGATYNAMANMQSVTQKYGPAPEAILVVSIVGALFVDFCNSFVITIFLNFV